MLAADPTKVSQRAKKRGLPQVPSSPSFPVLQQLLCVLNMLCCKVLPLMPPKLMHGLKVYGKLGSCALQMGTLGGGNHYAEIQIIDKVFDEAAARKMGIDQEGQACTCIFPDTTNP